MRVMSAAADHGISLNAISSVPPLFSSSPPLTDDSGTLWIEDKEMSTSEDWSAPADGRLTRLMSAVNMSPMSTAAESERASSVAGSPMAAASRAESIPTDGNVLAISEGVMSRDLDFATASTDVSLVVKFRKK